MAKGGEAHTSCDNTSAIPLEEMLGYMTTADRDITGQVTTLTTVQPDIFASTTTVEQAQVQVAFQAGRRHQLEELANFLISHGFFI